jgi:hypothetical protein
MSSLASTVCWRRLIVPPSLMRHHAEIDMKAAAFAILLVESRNVGYQQ